MKKEQILGLIRHTLTFVGGLLVMKGLVDETIITEVVGAFVTLVGGMWSIIEKTKNYD